MRYVVSFPATVTICVEATGGDDERAVAVAIHDLMREMQAGKPGTYRVAPAYMKGSVIERTPDRDPRE